MLLALVFVIGSVFLYSSKSEDAAAKIGYQSAVAKSRDIVSTIIADGKVEFESQVAVSSEVISKVESVLVKPGDVVTKGQVLVLLDDKQIKAQVSQSQFSLDAGRSEAAKARVMLELAKQKLSRMKGLIDRHYISQDDLETQENQVLQAKQSLRTAIANQELARASLDESQELLRKTVIRAPIAGTVLSVDTTAGETAVPSTQSFAGTALVKIAKMGQLLIKADVGEADVNRISIGEHAKVYFPALNGVAMNARLVRIALAADTNSGNGTGTGASPGSGSVNFPATFALTDVDAKGIRTGMSCRVELARRNGNEGMVSVPVQAIRPAAGGAEDQFIVWKISGGGEIAPVKVVLGIADDTYQEVSGLKSGDRVVTGPADFLNQLRDDRLGHNRK
ncbi:efflux RND transporter periplasmic adaptor subunit [Frateuria sp. Soil773]|uniref:efflux RND transporter periplasmic adaptor subunit n=1 Tax=Frateuria sp. Soil773 TaxID=1736407 RepID=UPI00138F9475|nr:efflux RND transporter periplasmic adaptor subunit [Frateuria sp. Soil773]